MRNYWPFILGGLVLFLTIGGGVTIYNATRGLRNNNAGNIKKGQAWQGLAPSQTDTTFDQFKTPEYGIRAIYKTLLTYRKKGLFTINDIINRWSATDQEAYVNNVEYWTGINRNEPLAIADYPNIIKAIIRQENGVNPYPDSLIAKAIGIV